MKHPLLTAGVTFAMFALSSASSAASDGLVARFVEGAPKDLFVLENASKCDLKSARIILDLSGSSAGLIFDVTGSGAGVEVFQPLEIVSGASALRTLPELRDGDNRLELQISGLSKGNAISFTIDVDDTLGGRETIVDTSEIVGATVALQTSGQTRSAVFDESASAEIEISPCTLS